MKRITSRFASWVLTALVVFSFSLTFSVGSGFGRDVTPADQKAYQEALEDTEVAE